MKFQDKLYLALAGSAAFLAFGTTTIKPDVDIGDDKAVKAALKAEKLKIGDTASVRIFLPLDEMNCYYGQGDVTIGGQSGNAENVGRFVGKTAKESQPVPGEISDAKAFAKTVYAKQKNAAHNSQIGKIQVGPMELVDLVVTEEGWRMDEGDARSLDEQLAEAKDEIGDKTIEIADLKMAAQDQAKKLDDLTTAHEAKVTELTEAHEAKVTELTEAHEAKVTELTEALDQATAPAGT